MEDPFRELNATFRRMFPMTATLGLYEESLALLQHMENRLAKTDARRWMPLSVHRVITVPAFLLLRGFGQIISGFGPTYSFVSFLAIAGLFVSVTVPGQVGITLQGASVATSFVAVLLFLFAAPSTYCSSGVNGKHVGAVRAKLAQFNVKSEARIEMIARNLKVFEERTKRRVAAYRWVLAAAWAIYFAPALAGVVGVSTGGPITRESTTIAFGWLLVAFLLFDSYARGVDILFRSLELGCNEEMAALKKAAESTGPANVAHP